MSKDVKTNAMRMLEKSKINYTPRAYECGEFIDGEHIADILGLPYEKTFKTIVAAGKSGKNYVFVLPVDRELDFKKCAAAAGEKSAEPVHVKDITALTGYVRGGVSPVGMKKQFPTFLHISAKEQDYIFVSGGKLGLQLEIRPDDLLSACGGVYADITF